MDASAPLAEGELSIDEAETAADASADTETHDEGLRELNISEDSSVDDVSRADWQEYAKKLARTLSCRRKRTRDAILQFMESAINVEEEVTSSFAPFEFIAGAETECFVIEIRVRKVRDFLRVYSKTRCSTFVDDAFAARLGNPSDEGRSQWPTKFTPGASGERIMWCKGPNQGQVNDPNIAIDKIWAMVGKGIPARETTLDIDPLRGPALPSLDIDPLRPWKGPTPPANRRLQRSASSVSATQRSISNMTSASTTSLPPRPPKPRRILSLWDLGSRDVRPIAHGPKDAGFRECAHELNDWCIGQASHAPVHIRTPGPGHYDNYYNFNGRQWAQQRGQFSQSPAALVGRRTGCGVSTLACRERTFAK